MTTGSSTITASPGKRADNPLLSLTVSSTLFEPISVPRLSVAEVIGPRLSERHLADSFVKSGYSLLDHLIGDFAREETWAGRLLTGFLPRLGVAITGSFAMHESGHFFLLYDGSIRHVEPAPSGHRDRLASINGINSNAWSADRSLLFPYEGVMSDLAYIVQKFDLPLYAAVYTPLLNGDGDIAEFQSYRERIGSVDEGAWIAGLSVWMLSDLWAPAWRVIKYVGWGEASDDPHRPGEWTLRTTGRLSLAGGPLFGLKFAKFFEGGSAAGPTLISAEGWAAPSGQHTNRAHTLEMNPFGINLEAARLPLPVRVGPFALAASAQLFLSVQRPNIWFETHDRADRIIALFGAALGVHLQSSDVDLFVTGQCRQEGFLWDESFGTGCFALVGVNAIITPNGGHR